MLQKTFTNIPTEMISDSLMTGVFKISFDQPQPKKAIIQRIAEADADAAKECLEIYGNYVWAIARKFTKTKEEAEKAVQEIFLDVWKNAEFFNSKKFDEQSFIAHISLKRLLK